MLRLSSQQALKTLRNPLRNPLQGALRKTFQVHQVHSSQRYNEPVPFFGPASYETLGRLFSSTPGPQLYYSIQKGQEASERREWVDIHDIGFPDPKNYDALITDVTEDDLKNEVAEVSGIKFLQKVTKAEADEEVKVGHGFLYGYQSHMMFPYVVGYGDKAHWVFFLADTCSPLTYVSKTVSVPA